MDSTLFGYYNPKKVFWQQLADSNLLVYNRNYKRHGMVMDNIKRRVCRTKEKKHE